MDHAILIDNGVLYDLNNLIPAGSGWELIFVSGINEKGEIVVTGLYNREVRSCLLTPRK